MGYSRMKKMNNKKKDEIEFLINWFLLFFFYINVCKVKMFD